MPKCKSDKPWERQQGESEKAFEAFTVYRDLGNARTISAVSEKLSKSRQLLSRWKAKWKWEERVRAYDNDLVNQAKAKAEKDIKDMTGRHIKIAMQLQAKALEALTSLDIENMSAKDLLQYIKEATALERQNRLLEANAATGKADATGGPSSLADTIMAAYKRRKDGDEE